MTSSPEQRVNFLGYTQGMWLELLEDLGEKPFHATQVMKWIHHRLLCDFEGMTDLSKKLRQHLMEYGCLTEPEVARELVSTDGTRKWLMRSLSGSLFETVYIPEEDRGTLCVSSQVGCALDCSFCSTGKQGFNSNLTTAEIIGQRRIARRRLAEVYPDRRRAVTNVVMMGMGEPLLNIDNVLPAAELMMDDLGYGISKRKVTVSTAGVVPGIEKLCESTDVSLAISLHAPNNELRDQLVPINKKYPLEQLLSVASRYARNLGEKRTITIEYTLMDGINDAREHAIQLSHLLRDFPCKINLIPFNPFPGAAYKRPSMAAVRGFQERLVGDGYSVTVRTTRGEDIQAACGQLVGEVADRTRRQAHYKKIQAGEIA
ncbi:MAG: 23S rRNA (adenine(2503)-C(2))-methyltransferase RlmN [Gammaproteobacteria bacterium]|nr:23S rRNA (adenine(2503)-C(2))-methyltransferase RlmN [Gammaproteobacteria bacterium]